MTVFVFSLLTPAFKIDAFSWLLSDKIWPTFHRWIPNSECRQPLMSKPRCQKWEQCLFGKRSPVDSVFKTILLQSKDCRTLFAIELGGKRTKLETSPLPCSLHTHTHTFIHSTLTIVWVHFHFFLFLESYHNFHQWQTA